MPRKHREKSASGGYNLRDVILGGQDGLVNVLGVILAVATATQDAKIVIIAGLAATFAESISMAAVAYTSTKAARDFYVGKVRRERKDIESMPNIGKEEIRDIYRKKGFRGRTLNEIVRTITADKYLWLRTIMEEKMHLHPEESVSPGRDAWIVGLSAFVGSLVPLLPFFFVNIHLGVILSLMFSITVLFVTGVIKNYITIGNPLRGGLEIAIIGMAAAIIGYAIGAILGVMLYAT